MSWYVKVTTIQYKEFKKYSSYDEPQRALAAGLEEMANDFDEKEIRYITLEKA